jgi:hypothetical protein
MKLLLHSLILCSTLGFSIPSSIGMEPPGLSAVFRTTLPDGSESLTLDPGSMIPSRPPSPPAFRAIVQRDWPSGLLPLFPVEKAGRFELRRLPPKGRENFTDPLFFVLPLPHDTNAARIAGRWAVQSINRENHRHRLNLDLAVDGERVGGRLDQDSDYRFAYVTDGQWRTNHLTLVIEYIRDRYELTADLRNATLTGTWRRTDDTDQGVWEATRLHPPVLVSAGDSVPLHEWRNQDGHRRYLTNATTDAPGWHRIDPPLGGVWPAK